MHVVSGICSPASAHHSPKLFVLERLFAAPDLFQAVRERLAGLRSSFQEVAVVKLRLQQELAAEEHKVEAADKRAPELDAEKKLAAQARYGAGPASRVALYCPAKAHRWTFRCSTYPVL